MEVSWKKKIDDFYEAIKERGYEVKLNEASVDPYVYEQLEHTVSKNNYHHVSVKEHFIVTAPLEYVIDIIEEEFKTLETK